MIKMEKETEITSEQFVNFIVQENEHKLNFYFGVLIFANFLLILHTVSKLFGGLI